MWARRFGLPFISPAAREALRRLERAARRRGGAPAARRRDEARAGALFAELCTRLWARLRHIAPRRMVDPSSRPLTARAGAALWLMAGRRVSAASGSRLVPCMPTGSAVVLTSVARTCNERDTRIRACARFVETSQCAVGSRQLLSSKAILHTAENLDTITFAQLKVYPGGRRASCTSQCCQKLREDPGVRAAWRTIHSAPSRSASRSRCSSSSRISGARRRDHLAGFTHRRGGKAAAGDEPQAERRRARSARTPGSACANNVGESCAC